MDALEVSGLLLQAICCRGNLVFIANNKLNSFMMAAGLLPRKEFLGVTEMDVVSGSHFALGHFTAKCEAI